MLFCTCRHTPALCINYTGETEVYKSKKNENIVAKKSELMRSWLDKQVNTFLFLVIATSPSHTHSLPLLFSVTVSLSLYPHHTPHLFLEDDMGDPDVTFHWPMVSREGLDWCALPMPLLFKNA